ncbi:MAG: HAD hydrolase-like protein [Acidobacteriota bacterium]
MTTLLLFDIDGTMLHCGPKLGGFYADTYRTVLGVEPQLVGFDWSGKTDMQIAYELGEQGGLEREQVTERLDTIRDLYAGMVREGLFAEDMTVLPGVREILEHLTALDHVTIGLLTGNWRVTAELKLAPFDLWRLFPFGAFGDDGHHRRMLPPKALERAAVSAGRSFHPDETLIIGDAPRDIDCAHHHGIRCLSVATGRFSEDQLKKAGADHVFADMAAAAEEIERMVDR